MSDAKKGQQIPVIGSAPIPKMQKALLKDGAPIPNLQQVPQGQTPQSQPSAQSNPAPSSGGTQSGDSKK